MIHNLVNPSAGAAQFAQYNCGNDGAASAGHLRTTSTTYTPGSAYAADSVHLVSERAGGLALATTHASGTIRFFTNGTQRGLITAAGLFQWTTFGSNSFLASGSGANILQVGNPTAGAANQGSIQATSDTVFTVLNAYSSTWTTSGAQVQGGSILYGSGVGGLSIGAFDAAGDVRIYTGGQTLRATFFANGAIGINTTTDMGIAGGVTLAGRLSVVGGATISAPIFIPEVDVGSLNHSLIIERNSNVTPIAASLGLDGSGGTLNYLWVDATGVVRTSTSGPASGDTSGTIIGTQTSMRESKQLRGETLAPAAALAQLLRTPVHEFTYQNGAYNGSVFHGIVADEAPMLMMDAGRSFSPISAFGYTVQAIKALQAQIDGLKAARSTRRR